jgi:hypothetical protein
MVGVILMTLWVGASSSAFAQPAAPQCQPAGPLVRLADVPESSGVAASQRMPGRLWTHNDSGAPTLFALDTQGKVTARVQFSGAKLEDWEAVAVGPCAGGSCVYLADIGDNEASRTRITIHRVPEPAAEDSVPIKETFHATYPDGAQDAEALLVAPDGRIFIVTKGETGPIALYRFPEALRPGATHQLERVGKPRESGKGREAERVTDGAVSTDGSWVVLRSKHALAFYRAAEFFGGSWQEGGRVDVKAAGEPQGEGIAIGPDGTVYLTGEGGGKSQAGTFVRFACSVSR